MFLLKSPPLWYYRRQTLRLTDMQADHFDVYDIDGTLTIPGHDLWYLCTRNLSADKDLFDRYVAEWKSEIQNGMAPFDCSLTMMKRGLALLKNGVSSELVADEVQRIASNLIDEELVWREAINFLKSRVRAGSGAVFSNHELSRGELSRFYPCFAPPAVGSSQTELRKVVVSGLGLIGALATCCSDFKHGSQQIG